MTAFWLSFWVIFVAELGDKSQLMALTFAARMKALPVLVGITIATLVVHAVSVLVGAAFAVRLPTAALNITAGLSFLGFAAWTLRGDKLSDAAASRAERASGAPVVAASVAFFLAELGDKTMLATITLATTNGLVGVWLGSTAGMVAADALAIGVGNQLGRRLPERAIRLGAATAFVAFGVVLVAQGIRGL